MPIAQSKLSLSCSVLAHMPEYNAVVRFYGDRVAKRSQVPLINHIHEGVEIINYIAEEDSLNAELAFCLHPMLQADEDLIKFDTSCVRSLPALVLAMEYRRVANSYLSKHPGGSLVNIDLSPLPDVKIMLIADKVQNRKDFDLYHKATHPNSKRLTQYFNEWLEFLGINEKRYLEILKDVEKYCHV